MVDNYELHETPQSCRRRKVRVLCLHLCVVPSLHVIRQSCIILSVFFLLLQSSPLKTILCVFLLSIFGWEIGESWDEILLVMLLLLVFVCYRQSAWQSVEDGIGDSTRSWSDLPPELLALIANRLGIIELLGFRGVCKDWRSASSSASADIESAVGIKPSFLVYSDKDQKGSFYYRTDGKIYRIHIPELENATCIASNHGWLLLLEQGSVFFFCPFSRARIDLPQLPVSEIPNPVAAFSTPPTSAECMISVANPCNNSKVELYVLNRGDSMWTKHEKSHPNQLGTITGALYFAEESSFYFLDSNRKVIKFSLKEKKFFHYRVVHASEDPYCDCLPFGYNVNYFTHCGLRTSMGLQDDASISTCGTRLPGNKYDTYVNNEKMEAPDGNANSQFKGIWIHARFFQVPPTQSWSL